nr:AAA-ATPase At5g57480-like [Ipomoea batatas]
MKEFWTTLASVMGVWAFCQSLLHAVFPPELRFATVKFFHRLGSWFSAYCYYDITEIDGVNTNELYNAVLQLLPEQLGGGERGQPAQPDPAASTPAPSPSASATTTAWQTVTTASGRMDMHIHMSYCTFPALKILLKNYLGYQDAALSGDLEDVIAAAEMTPADISEVLIKNRRNKKAAVGELAQVLRARAELFVSFWGQEDQMEKTNRLLFDSSTRGI